MGDIGRQVGEDKTTSQYNPSGFCDGILQGKSMSTQGRLTVATDGLIKIRVYGIPRQFPKKEVANLGTKTKPRFMPVDRDYRQRKNPITGKIEKYDHGYLRRWYDHVTRTVRDLMYSNDIQPFPKDHPVVVSCIFFIPKAKSCKLLMPSQKPDEDNYLYAVRNALGRTPMKKGVPGKYPNGVLYYDDAAVVWQENAGKVWATEKHPPGVLILVRDALPVFNEIMEYVDKVDQFVNRQEEQLI